MTEGEKYFKQQHDKFLWIRSQSIWNGEQIRQIYPKKELICHVMLSEELFYLWNDDAVKRALVYIRDAYPNTTEEDLRKVYETYSDMVTAIYG